ncbi:MAG: hypothetical protein ABEJ73_12560 [Haloplanus sp.]
MLGIGDTIIALPDVDGGLTDRVVRFRVTAFDATDATGEGALLGVADAA